MPLLDRLRRLLKRPKLTLDDPVLGKLEHLGRMQWKKRPPYDAWESTSLIDLHGQRVGIRVFAQADGPAPGPLDLQRALFAELLTRYPALRADMERPMFDAYQAVRADADPALQESVEIWRIARLSTVEVQGFDGVDLGFLYEVDWTDPEHDLSVHVRDWKVLDVGKEG